MAFAWHCSLLSIFLLAARLSCDATDYYNILDLEAAWKHEQWMAEYGRVYKDEAEKAHRFEIFKKNFKHIKDYNNGGENTHTLGLNEFADLTNEEFVASYTGFKIPDNMNLEEGETDDVNVNVDPPPASLDWRDAGAVSEVKHQQGCECCWAFAAVATVEGLVQIKTDVLHDLSVQQIVDCDNGSTHCQRGFYTSAYKYIANGGLTTWANYPYTAVQDVCDVDKENHTVAKIRSHRWATKNNEARLLLAVAEQPVAVAIDASIDVQLHKAGIFNGSCGTAVNHAVTLIGYGEEDSTKYWIVKNTWGTGWGEQGFFRLPRDIASKEGYCGVAMYPMYPVY